MYSSFNLGLVLSIALGGAAGSLARFWLSSFMLNHLGRGFPYGTLSVNVLGSFLMGLLFIYFTQRQWLDSLAAKGLLVGFLGAFTTFSTFSIENLNLLLSGEWFKFILNILLNVVLCLAAVGLGVLVARSFW